MEKHKDNRALGGDCDDFHAEDMRMIIVIRMIIIMMMMMMMMREMVMTLAKIHLASSGWKPSVSILN